MSFVPAGLSNPTTATLPRRPMSVRRTSHIDIGFDGPLRGGRLVLSGRARDLLTDASGTAEVLDEASVVAHLDEERRLQSLETSPVDPGTIGLIGRCVGKGFRAAVDASLPPVRHRSPLYLLLDDLPVATLISGYAALYDTGAGTSLGPDVRAAMVKSDICSGWRSDGTMMVALRAGETMPAPLGPPAPSLNPSADPTAWHDIPALEARAMRRQRLVDVSGDDPLIVAGMFRDTHTSAGGAETVLHEYSVDVIVDRDTLKVVRAAATPRSLPWAECPSAGASAARLEGESLAGLRDFVRREMVGTSTCTHLNDLLRSLADVAVLAPLLRGLRD
ncbi:MAG: DUF2889 domain-containing protein [Acidimicrobiales bacterium]